MRKPLNSSRNPGAFSHAEQFELVAFAHAIEAAVIAQDLDARLGNPRARTQVLHGSEDAIPPGFHDALCRLGPHAGEARDRWQERCLADDKLLCCRGVEIDMLALEAAQIHFPSDLQDDERRVLFLSLIHI